MHISRLRRLLVGTHVASAVVLVAMAAPQIPKISDQIASGYVPAYYGLIVALTAAPITVAATMLATLAIWLRRGVRWPLLLADFVTSALAWSVFTVFVLWSDFALALFGLAPACLAVAAYTAVVERRRVATA